jgi:hypothetical protein
MTTQWCALSLLYNSFALFLFHLSLSLVLQDCLARQSLQGLITSMGIDLILITLAAALCKHFATAAIGN